jgi:hypothetical protein
MQKLLLAIFIFMMPIVGLAQFNDTDLNILIGSPQGDFRDNLDRTAVGINGSIAYGIPKSPIQLGIELGIMIYGEDERFENFNPNIPEVRVKVVTDYSIFTSHFFLRYEALNGNVRPYVDGLVGLNYLFTKTEVQDRNNQNNEIASETNFDDTAFSYGIGGGTKILVYSTPENLVFINLKARYLFGDNAKYLQPGSIEVNNGVLTFDESESQTNLLTIHLGVPFKF